VSCSVAAVETTVPSSGRSFPLGATPAADGVNFSLFSRHASGVELLFFEDVEDQEPSRVMRLDPYRNRTYYYWHAEVPGLEAGQLYGYRICGPCEPGRGHRFDNSKVLLDPYGRCVAVPSSYDRNRLAKRKQRACSMKSAIVDSSAYDWEGDSPLRLPSARTVIYEMHVRGFTRHPSSGLSENIRGTYAGVTEKIPYLTNLGITAVELLPIFQFDMQDAPPGLVNYWGYAPVSFFAPHIAYSSRRDTLGAIDEFRDMVKALHRAGIEVILDVVYNHTAEGDEHGPTQCFRGIDNCTYYILEKDRSRYSNYSGTGNTLNANHSIVRRMIVDSLCYWVDEMHVDGFRFDLASILARDSSGHVLANPPLLWDIDSDPRLAGTKLIAEAWDAAGLYQVGTFIGDAWKEWNGRFRDDVRDFFRCSPGSVRHFADRFVGSPQVYGHESREPEQTVNFVTCHDGFTLNDLVSYEQKHNEANKEGNGDGCNDNRSCNYGVEGPSSEKDIESVRNRQIKNLLATTLLSLGIPMMSMGDEVRRTQLGNNNAYCQDNEISWFDWNLLDRHADVLRFVKLLINRRVQRDIAPEIERRGLSELLSTAKHAWHGIKLHRPNWSDDSHSLALTIETAKEGLCFHIMANAFWGSLEFQLPEGIRWRRWVDTSLDSPHDIVEWQNAPIIELASYFVGPQSFVVLTGTI
jgi:isoamylase